jgi:hypothetical protein
MALRVESEKVPPGRACTKGATVAGKRARMSFIGKCTTSPICTGTADGAEGVLGAGAGGPGGGRMGGGAGWAGEIGADVAGVGGDGGVAALENIFFSDSNMGRSRGYCQNQTAFVDTKLKPDF